MAAAAAAATQLLGVSQPVSHRHGVAPSQPALNMVNQTPLTARGPKSCTFPTRQSLQQIPNALPRALGNGNSSVSDDGEDGVLLGTLKLSPNTKIPMFEALLFQWANSLCQGANIPLPDPLKVDKVKGGVRLGFTGIGSDGASEVIVYIDCLVFPAEGPGTGPIFRAIRNGPKKEQSPLGEPRIIRSLLAALQKSVEIASV